MHINVRLITTSAAAFMFYAGWAYWANMLATDDIYVLLRSALVQGSYSAVVTLVFTSLVEWVYTRSHGTCLSLAFIVPVMCAFHSTTPQNLAIRRSFNEALDASATLFRGLRLPAVLLSPLPALLVQSALVVCVNLINQTPNLWLTVAPSIMFSAIYGYIYVAALYRQQQ
ncbi:hypothetical protein [Aestuariibacter salexigens]|uniref:hypothetical protein n=1 Tax=Aestuariibacter salexigens TaxID=226010 RepID=UPI00047AE51E|nr:hypothetical protein [Aestuariibacter salexigens]